MVEIRKSTARPIITNYLWSSVSEHSNALLLTGLKK